MLLFILNYYLFLIVLYYRKPGKAVADLLNGVVLMNQELQPHLCQYAELVNGLDFVHDKVSNYHLTSPQLVNVTLQ